jgi:hypothetical protein
MNNIEKIGHAIQDSHCYGREGPYGGYNYDDRYCIRDMRYTTSPDWGKIVFETYDHDEYMVEIERLTLVHTARAAIDAVCEWEPISEYVDDGKPVLRPHINWGPMVVRYMAAKSDKIIYNWVSVDYSTQWPDDAFLPYWKSLEEIANAIPS